MNTQTKKAQYDLLIICSDEKHIFSHPTNPNPFCGDVDITISHVKIAMKDGTNADIEPAYSFFKNEKKIAEKMGIFSEEDIIEWVNDIIKADNNLFNA